MEPEYFTAEAWIERLRARFESGDATALLDAISIYLDRDQAAPEWVVRAFGLAWHARYQCAEARTLGEAFGIDRPPNWRRGRARKDALSFVMWQRVLQERKKGAAIGRGLFDDIAEELSAETGLQINGTDVQEAYYGVTKNAEIPVNAPDS